MARFTNLHHVGEVLGATLSASLDPPLAAGGVMVGPPLDNANSPSEHVRLSLMWVERQAGHESDPWEREADGTRTPPPLSLSAYYLVTCYGTNSLGDPERGHELLGSVLRIFHRDSRLELPLAALPGRGEGGLGVDLVQTRPELIEKLFAPLQLKHRPFALYEVGPVQLVSLQDVLPPAPLVAPEGLVLTGPRPSPRPVIERLSPAVQAAVGRVLVTGDFPGVLERVWVGDAIFEPADLTVVEAGRALALELSAAPPGTLLPGSHDLTVFSGGSASESAPLALVDAGLSTLDPPLATSWSRSVELPLGGRNLGGRCGRWPGPTRASRGRTTWSP